MLKKKVIILKKVQKKFLEIQIYIRRECQNFYGFRKQFSNYSITPFLLENEILNRNKSKINTSIEEKMKYMKALFIPINEIKNKEKKKNEKNKNENVINFINEDNNILIDSANDELNKYIINKEEEINFYENKKMDLCKIKLLYKSKFIPKKNMFKNEININLNISQDIQNNNENLESNINNTFYELFTIESVAKSGIYNNTFLQDDDIYK